MNGIAESVPLPVQQALNLDWLAITKQLGLPHDRPITIQIIQKPAEQSFTPLNQPVYRRPAAQKLASFPLPVQTPYARVGGYLGQTTTTRTMGGHHRPSILQRSPKNLIKSTEYQLDDGDADGLVETLDEMEAGLSLVSMPERPPSLGAVAPIGNPLCIPISPLEKHPARSNLTLADHSNLISRAPADPADVCGMVEIDSKRRFNNPYAGWIPQRVWNAAEQAESIDLKEFIHYNKIRPRSETNSGDRSRIVFPERSESFLPEQPRPDIRINGNRYSFQNGDHDPIRKFEEPFVASAGFTTIRNGQFRIKKSKVTNETATEPLPLLSYDGTCARTRKFCSNKGKKYYKEQIPPLCLKRPIPMTELNTNGIVAAKKVKSARRKQVLPMDGKESRKEKKSKLSPVKPKEKKKPKPRPTKTMTCARIRPLSSIFECARLRPFKGMRKELNWFYYMMHPERKWSYIPKKLKSQSRDLATWKGLKGRTYLVTAEMPLSLQYRLFLQKPPQIYLSKSKIHGIGVFMDEEMETGRLILEYRGEVIRSSLVDKREACYRKQGYGSYMFVLDGDYAVDATKNGSVARFINHSCDPNCSARVISYEDTKKIVLFAAKYIEKGEELSYNYKLPLEEEKIPCFCKASNCRKFLN